MGFVAETLGFKKSGGVKAAQAAAAQFNDLTAPQINAIRLARLKSIGDARDFVTDQGQSEFSNINEDPALRDAQMAALGQAQEIAQGGFNDEDRARIDQINREQALRERGQREAILQNAQARGMGGQQLNVLSSLQAQQGEADRAAQQGLQLNAEALNRARQGLALSADMATNLRGMDLQKAQREAAAQDAINQFNAAQRSAAGQSQFANQQRISDENTGLQNQQTMFNQVDRRQQNFSNQMALRSARANALNKVGAAQDAQSQRTAGVVGAGLGAAGSILGRKG